MSNVWRYWGYALAALMVPLWIDRTAGATMMLLLSLILAVYFLFQAPVWCGAATRGGRMCRNNTSGVVLGCHLRQHKWQKIKMAFVPHLWRQLNRGLWTSPTTCLASLGAILSLCNVAAVLLFGKKIT